ncbi:MULTISPECIES: hypothetical protein [unclassified Burkholderia]|uniref:hypothetical protein n=1 Tax=unclassified Burkholderia TaxID=2613784 RepID=UPI000F5607C9|nr:MULTISPECIES: hypothetical protein [unclassified Burkholderia]
MAKVRFIGDPRGDEHRRGTDFAGVALALGQWVDMDDAPARKLLANPHFEVEGVVPLAVAPRASAPVASQSLTIDAMAHGLLAKSHAELSDEHAALKADHADLLEAFAARGAELNEAHVRIVELEAALANAAPAAQGEGDGRDADGSGKPGAEEDQGARDGAGGRRRGSAGR